MSTVATKTRDPPIVAIDCEMIGIGRRSYLARVTIVDFSGRVIYDKLVKPPIMRNATLKINYRTAVSGVTEEMLKHGESFPRVQSQVMSILKSKIVLGHGLTNDFNALQILDWRERYRYFDTTEIPFFMKAHPYYPDRMQPRKLKDLVAEYLGKVIQVEGAPHDSAEDARAVIELYRALPEQFVRSPVAAPAATAKPHNVGNKARRQTRKRSRSA
jgi:DNA polymerase III epsilon subunit-like protein